jgi:hypothetical protein
VPERWRSPAARELVKAVRDAGGSVERPKGKVGKLLVTGPDGRSVTINEPAAESRRDLRSSSAARLIAEKTGLSLGQST